MSSQLIVRGESVPGREGRVVLSRLLKASSAGLAPSSGIGVARYVSRARNTSSCLRISFAVRTARSAAPLDCGKCGLLVTWLKFHSDENCWNSADENCRPLSYTSVSGIP